MAPFRRDKLNVDIERQDPNKNDPTSSDTRAHRGLVNMFHKKTDNKYHYFNPKLKSTKYPLGDMFTEEKLIESRLEWQENSQKPYQKYVQQLSGKWAHFRLLLDFMEVGTSPMRWQKGQTGPGVMIEGVTRNERQRKTKARILQYDAANTPTMSDEIRSPEALLEGLRKPVPDTTKLKLVVVEDLSRDVIETLGDYLKIEPEFFRAHILDYVWSNVRDFWRSPPNLSVMIRHQTWFQLRFVRARYFKSGMGFKEGFDEALTFNVARRPDDDQSNTSIWDDVEGKVGLTRSKVSFWMKPSNGNEPAVGVLLLDPTITKGFHLWHGYRNWAEPPNMYDKDDIGNPQQSTLFQDYLYWACRPETFLMNDHGNNNADNSSVFKLPIAVLLHLVCAEWQTISDYVKTRLNQVDWEIAQPDKFIPSPSPDTPAHQTPIDRTLLKLHAWRRYVPMFREMLSETLIHIFKATPSTSITAVHGRHNDETLSLAPPRESSYLSLIKDDPTVTAYRTDFELVLSYMEECQQRIDRLTHVATAAISIQDSRRSIRDNNNIQYLTYLATFFIPMSLVAALLSMQPDVSELGDTMKVWAEASLPIAFVILLVTVIVSYVRALKSYQ